MRNKIALVNLSVAVAVVASFMALSGPAAASPVHPRTTTVQLAGWASTPAEPKALQKVVNSFQRANPSIKVHLNEYSGGDTYNTAVLGGITVGKGPDVFYVDSSVFRTWQAAGALAPIDSFVKRTPSFDIKDIYPGLRKSFTVGGKLYGLPKDYSTLGLFVNTGIWKAAKMGKAPTTWAAFAKDACTITRYERKHGVKNVYGAGLANDQARWNPLLQSLGGRVLNAAQTKSEINNKAGVAAIGAWASLVKKGCAAWPSQVGQGWSGGEFGPGNAAMVWEGPWLIPYMQTTYPKVHFKIFPLPVKGNLAFTVAYSMNPHSKVKSAAWKLLSYLTGKVGEQKWVNLFQVLPARKSLKAPKGDGVFVKGAANAQGWVYRAGYFDTNGPYTVLNNDFVKVQQGSMTAKSAAVDVQNAINHWLQTIH